MIASMFNLDHRLTELRPTADERRLARRREAVGAVARNSRSALDLVRERISAGTLGGRPSRAAVG